MFLRNLLGIAIAFGMATAAHAEMVGTSHKIDCEQLRFSFTLLAQADEAYCYRLRRSEASSSDSVGDLSVVFESLHLYAGPQVVYILSGRAGDDVYFSSEPLRSEIRNFDELEDVKNWSGEEDFDDYEIGSFDAVYDGEPVNCYAFREMSGARISNRGSHMGPTAFILGFHCWFGADEPGRAAIEATIAGIE